MRSALVILAIGATLAAGGCAKARAATVPDGPPLAMPAPPERLIPPAEPLAPVIAQPIEPELPPPAAAAPKPAAKPAPPKPQPTPAPPAAQAPPPPPTDTRELQTNTATSAAAERNVRDLLARAARDLGRVNYRQLSTDGRAQYDQSKRFSEQAQDALRERNFVFAQTLADKAATLAAELLQ